MTTHNNPLFPQQVKLTSLHENTSNLLWRTDLEAGKRWSGEAAEGEEDTEVEKESEERNNTLNLHEKLTPHSFPTFTITFVPDSPPTRMALKRKRNWTRSSIR